MAEELNSSLVSDAEDFFDELALAAFWAKTKWRKTVQIKAERTKITKRDEICTPRPEIHLVQLRKCTCLWGKK